MRGATTRPAEPLNDRYSGPGWKGLLASASGVALLAAFGTPAAAQAPSVETSVEEIVVTGTSIRGIAPTGSSVIGLSQQEIQKTGVRTTAELLATLPQIAQFNQVPTGTSRFGGAVAQVSLRPGLGSGATLVLLNGRRLVPVGFLASRADVSNIPAAAIARVEVIPDGGSAIYGSDAVAGVVNFITRRDLNGAETSVRYSSADDYSGFDVSQAFGRTWAGGSAMVVGQYIGHTRLRFKDRPEFSDVGTVSPGLATSCPTASVGASNPRCDASQIGGDIQPDEQRATLYAAAEQQFSPSIKGWADFNFASSLRRSQDVQPALPSTTFSAANPFNTSGVNQTVFYRPVSEFGEGLPRRVKFRAWQSAAGVDFDLPAEWAASVFGNYGESKNIAEAVSTNNYAYQQAMLGTTTATAFDPFQHRTSAGVLAAILDANELSDVTLKLGQLGAKADGPVFDLPGGQVRVAVGAEYRYEFQGGSRRLGSPTSQRAVGPGFLSVGDGSTSRNVSSAFGEIFVPLVGDDNALPMFQALSLSMAVRYDHYDDFGGTVNPKIGVDWTLVDGFRLFGNWNTSYQAPNLGDTRGGAIDNRVEPVFGPSGVGPSGPGFAAYQNREGLIIAGGSTDMRPQTSKNFAAGFEATPRWLPGFRATATYYHIKFEDFVAFPGGQVFSIPSLRYLGIVAPMVNGVVTPLTASSPEVKQFTDVLPIEGGLLPSQIYWIAVVRRVNLSTRVQSGVDFDLSQRFDLAGGGLTARLAGTVITKDKVAGAPGAALSDVLPTDNRVRYAASLDYARGPINVGATLNHLSHRFSTVSQAFRVAEFDMFNVRASYQIDGSGLASGLLLSLNIDNLFDRPPPVRRDTAGGHDPNLNPFGRMVTVGVRKRW